MNRDSWARVKDHFDAMVELDPAAREAALQALDLAPEDLDLLQSLINSHDHADALLDRGSASALLELTEEDQADQDWTGRRLGPWQVGERIGRGGMSVVYRGQRADGQFEKTVAIKVLDADQLAADQRHRLVGEIRILAKMEHPGLARLIDSGQSDEGDPYLVMEFVAGTPLQDYIEENELTVGLRVELILQIAQALQYAHQRQVIHCDVKPSNILVTSLGQARLVDFGIAALDQAEPGKEIRLYCSPAYAAPERLLGAPPTTSQDVFALGAVLYRALSGRNIRPHDAITGIRIPEQPTPPSVATTESVNRSSTYPISTHDLKGDLDAICLKAIAVDPDVRYASVSDLIRDLEAWRDHRPVSARNGGRAYVLSRWLRRHTAIAALGLLLFGALIGGTLISLDQARRASLEADRAVASRDFLVSILEAADPTMEDGHDPTASELLQRGAKRIEEELNDQPELLVDLLHIIGKTQLARGLSEDAQESLERARLMLIDQPSHRQGPNILANRGLAAYQLGNHSESIEWLEQAVDAADQPGIASADRHGVKIQLADMLMLNNQPERALALTAQVLNDSPSLIEQIEALRMRGNALELTGQLEAAETSLLQALDLKQAQDPADVYIGMIQNDLGIVYWRMGDYRKSAEMTEAAWHRKRAVFGPDHFGTQSSLRNLALAYSAMGDHTAAENAFIEALDSLHRTFGNAPHPDRAYYYGQLALTHFWQNELTAARRALENGLREVSALSDSDDSSRAWLLKIDALLDLEEGQLSDTGAMNIDLASCLEPVSRTPPERRLCVAWWWFETQLRGDCPAVPPELSNAQLLADLPDQWQARWTEIQRRCGTRM